MHSKDIGVDEAVGRVLDQLVKDYRRRQAVIRKSRDELVKKYRDDSGRASWIESEATGNIDGLEWAVDRINEIRLEQLRRVERRTGSALAEHTDTVDLP